MTYDPNPFRRRDFSEPGREAYAALRKPAKPAPVIRSCSLCLDAFEAHELKRGICKRCRKAQRDGVAR